jgi:4-aminobutyrate aminotransferase-like enzyme
LVTPSDKLLQRRRRVTGTALPLQYRGTLHVVRAEGVYIYGADGREYLDAYNNVPHVGHCHPAVVAAMAEQAATLNTTCRYLYDGLARYAERLTALFAPGLDVCVFACSGSEANDLALRLAESYSGGRGVLVTQNSYHGGTQAVREASGTGPIGQTTRTIPPPDAYRLQMTPERYVEDVARVFCGMRRDGLKPKALLIDTQFVSDGVHTAWLPQLGPQVRREGGLVIADEIQVGFGRLGRHDWGHQALGVTPDIVTLGKAIGNGFPMSAVITRREILDTLDGPFLNTFGGNPVACAVGLAVLDVLERERLKENASRVGAYMFEGLLSLMARHDLIGDVRGAGLLAGIELVRCREARVPADVEAATIVEGLRERGVLVGLTGRYRNVVKIRPPLVFARTHVDHLIAALDGELDRFRAARPTAGTDR